MPLTDDRRRLPIEKLGTVLEATPDFMLVVSYNPGYQSILKDLKQSTRQRFVAMEFDYPDAEAETAIVAKEGGIDEGVARDERKQHLRRDFAFFNGWLVNGRQWWVCPACLGNIVKTNDGELVRDAHA